MWLWSCWRISCPQRGHPGKKIAFLSHKDGPWHLYIMDADASDQSQILSEVTDCLSLHYGFALERVISWTR